VLVTIEDAEEIAAYLMQDTGRLVVGFAESKRPGERIDSRRGIHPFPDQPLYVVSPATKDDYDRQQDAVRRRFNLTLVATPAYFTHFYFVSTD
jgi:hypothetical protein